MAEGSVGPTQRLREYEALWRPQLARVSLVAELELAADDLRGALSVLGDMWRCDYSDAGAARRVRASYPATFVVSVAGMGSIRYDRSGYYRAVFDAARLAHDHNLDHAWALLFLECLERLGLPTFPELDHAGPNRYVGRMLLHGGIPLDHVDELFEVATQGVRQTGSDDAAVVHAWMVQRTEAKRLYGATKTIERFMCFGDAYAVDFLDRALDLLTRVHDGDGVDDLHVGLPRRYLERAVELRETDQLPERQVARGQRGRPQLTRPEVRFDPYGVGLHLLLPDTADPELAGTWSITSGETTDQVKTFASRPGLPTEPAGLPLSSQSVEADVRSPSGSSQIITIIRLDDPALFFTADGRRVEASRRLPCESVWIVHPADRHLDHDGRLIELHELVARWPGWTAALVDLRAATKVHVGKSRVRLVETTRSATMLNWDEVEHLQAIDGPTVLRSYPRLRLPGSISGSRWQVTLSALKDGKESIHEFDVGQHDHDVALESYVEVGPASAVRVRARGPLGRSLRREFRVVPGLEVTCSPPVRILTQTGLSPAHVDLVGTNVAPFTLDEQEVRRRVDHDDLGSVVVSPPSVAILHVQAGRSASWRNRLLSLDAEDFLDEAGHLLVRLPGESGRPQMRVTDSFGRKVQSFDPTGPPRADHTFTFDLARVTDTLRTQGAATLIVESEVFEGPVVSIRPAALASAVHTIAGGGVLQFADISAEGVQVAVWSRMVPWLGPELGEVSAAQPSMLVPEPLIGLGPLRVMLRIDDPWVPTPLPFFPKAGKNVFDIDLAWSSTDLRRVHPFASYLARDTDSLEILDRLEDAVRLFQLAYVVEAPRHGDEIRGEMAPKLCEQPGAALSAALDIGLTGSDLARLVVDTQMACRSQVGCADVAQMEQLFARWPGAAVVVMPADLRHDRHLLVREYLRDHLGAAVDELLDGGSSTALLRPVFDNREFIDWPETVLQGIWSAMHVVPKVLFDQDAQAATALELLRSLRDPHRAPTCAKAVRESDDLIRHALSQVLEPYGFTTLSSAVRRRVQGDGWENLPATSLACSSVARIAARADDPSRIFTSRYRRALGHLAEIAPALVATDLLLAELAVQGAMNATGVRHD